MNSVENINHIDLRIYNKNFIGGAPCATVIIIGNGIGDVSSNPG